MCFTSNSTVFSSTLMVTWTHAVWFRFVGWTKTDYKTSHAEMIKWASICVRNFLYTYLLVSAFTLVGLNRLPPEQVQHLISLFMLLIEEDTLGFDWGKGPKSYSENALFAADFSTDALTERPEAAGCRNRHLLDFHLSPFSRVAALIPLGARPIRLGWPYQEPKFPTA